MEIDKRIENINRLIIIEFILIAIFLIRNLNIDYDTKCPLPKDSTLNSEIRGEE